MADMTFAIWRPGTNWEKGHDYDSASDWFNVTVKGHEITTYRGDKDEGWGMSLRFPCRLGM